MNSKALHFASIEDLCLFLQATNLRKFLLLGKKSILIAEFSTELLSLAIGQFHASMVDMPEAEIFGQRRPVTGMMATESIA